MVKPPNIALVLAFVIVLAVSVDRCRAQEVGGAVLMKDGNRVMRGTVTELGSNYHIQFESGSVSIPKDRVAHVGVDVKSLYEHRSASIGRWRSGDHMNFARWCILNGLTSEAIFHYQEVAKQHPDHPYVHKLAIELRQHLLSQPDFRDYLGLPPEDTSKPTSQLNSKPVAQPVQLASGFSESLAQYPQITTSFVQRVQPILLNRCSQSACHGALSKNELRIIPPYRDAHQRITNENLQSVLRQIDRDDGAALIRYATLAHGTQRQPSIAATESQLVREISAWIEFVKNPVASAVAIQADGPANPMDVVTAGNRGIGVTQSAEVALVPVKPGASGLRPVPKSDAGTAFPDGDRPTLSELEALDAELRRILGEANEVQGQQDPFDPASFNREG